MPQDESNSGIGLVDGRICEVSRPRFAAAASASGVPTLSQRARKDGPPTRGTRSFLCGHNTSVHELYVDGFQSFFSFHAENALKVARKGPATVLVLRIVR